MGMRVIAFAARGDFECIDGSDVPCICTLFAYIGSCHNLVVDAAM